MIPDDTGEPPTEPNKNTMGLFRKVDERIILLSCFDGIGTAAWILQDLVESIDLHIIWEVDPDCLAVLTRNHPSAQCRGDFMQDDPNEVAELIKQHDPTGTKAVLFVAAPPCPDFSRIKEDAPGSQGPEGHKFTAYCAFVNGIEMNIPHKRVGHLTENVLMERGEADYFASRLDCNVIASDAQDFGIISRPRLWWTRINWAKHRRSPMTGQKLQWSKLQKYHRLHHDAALQEAQDMDLEGLHLHPKVTAHEARVPCLTTPAPSEAGRPPPKKLKGKIHPEQKSRWLADGRTYAPWQYAEEALLHATDGTMTVPSAKVKEQLHMLPVNYTEAPGVSERARHRMLANGWHAGAARFILMLVLQSMLTISTACPCPSPSRSAMQYMLDVLDHFQPTLGPVHWPTEARCVPRTDSMWTHWAMAKQAQHPVATPPKLEPGLQQCLEIQALIGGSLPRLRLEIVDEIAQMADDAEDTTYAWWKALPTHVAQVYYNEEFKQISQIPLLIDLLKRTKMPSLSELAEDLHQGFQMVGRIHSGAGWLPRADQKYEFPVTLEAFQKNNRHYTLAKLRSNKVDPEWSTMLEELKTELKKGRMSGPYKAPEWWPIQTTSVDDAPLQELPFQNICISFCFSVSQSDKIRRCEDFRRSGHNSTVIAHDVPCHHDIQTFMDLALSQPAGDTPSRVWAQDLNGAYRQFAVRDPNDCFCVLMTPQGPLLLKHHALIFGATSSVWNFNRAADSLMFLSRRLLAVTLGHYVDDFIGIEPEHLVDSGFEQFTRLMRILGLRMKESKALPPDATQKILGINMTITQQEVILSPHPKRVHKIRRLIEEALRLNHLNSDTAQKMAGKLIFLTSTLFGQLGRAALQPIYARAHGRGDKEIADQLNGPLRSSLRTLLNLLTEIQPQVIPRNPDQPVIVIYTDAYFQLDGKTMSPGSTDLPRQWHKSKCHQYENGWGYVTYYNGVTRFAAGRIPPWVIKKYCSRKAYIYFLEITAQLIAFLACRHLPSTLVISFIDNASGLFALRKGYCKDPSICNLLAMTWRVLATLRWHVHLEWVSSEDNVSDKVSRHEFHEMQTIEAIQDQVHLDGLFKILSKVASDADYAHGQATQDALNLQLHHSSASHTGGSALLAPVWVEHCPSDIISLGSWGRSDSKPSPKRSCTERRLAC